MYCSQSSGGRWSTVASTSSPLCGFVDGWSGMECEMEEGLWRVEENEVHNCTCFSHALFLISKNATDITITAAERVIQEVHF